MVLLLNDHTTYRCMHKIYKKRYHVRTHAQNAQERATEEIKFTVRTCTFIDASGVVVTVECMAQCARHVMIKRQYVLMSR